MSGIQVTVPLQLLCRLMVAANVTENVTENVTLPSTWNSSFAETTDAQVLPSGWVAFPELGFAYKRSISALSHNDARESCLEEGGQLAVIDSWEKVKKITNYFADDPGWVGLGRGDFYGTNKWTTIDGKPTHNLPWRSGGPSGNVNCAYLSKSPSGLVDFHCDSTGRYLCEIALPRN